MKKEEIINCKLKIEFLSQTPLLLLAKLPFSVLIGLKLDKYTAGINPETNAKTNNKTPE